MQYLLLKRRELGGDGRSTGLMPCPRIPEGFLSRSLAQQPVDEALCILQAVQRTTNISRSHLGEHCGV